MKTPISYASGPAESSERITQGGGSSKLHADYVVASYEAPAIWKAGADFVCTGAGGTGVGSDYHTIRSAMLGTSQTLGNGTKGGVVHLSPGRFNIDAYFEIPPGITLQGTSPAAPVGGGAWGQTAGDVRNGTVLNMTSGGAEIWGAGHNTIRNLGIDYSTVADSPSTFANVETGLYGIFENVHIKGTYLQVDDFALVTNCRIEWIPHRSQMGIKMNAMSARVMNNSVRVRSDSGQYGEGTAIDAGYAGCVISNNVIETQEFGIKISGTEMVVSNNTITFGVNPVSSGVIGILASTSRSVYSGNNIYVPGHYGMDFSSISSNTNNLIVGNGITGNPTLDTGHAGNTFVANRLTTA